MIDVSPSKMLDDVRAAEEYRDHYIKDWDEDIQRYHGPGYKKETKTDLTDPENHPFEWVSLVVPQLVFGNPRVKVATSRIEGQAQVAKAMEFGLNRWIRDSKMRKLNEKLAVDFGMKWSIALVLPDAPADSVAYTEAEDPPGWPTVTRISPKMFLWDALAMDKENIRWMGHQVIRDKEDLIKEAKEDPDAGWNIDIIKSLTEGTGIDDVRDDDQENIHRDEVSYYEIWVPEHNEGEDLGKRKDGVEWGSWLTLGVGQAGEDDDRAEYIRKPRRYYGHRSGPYVFWGCYHVPEKVAPLGAVVAVAAQADELNDHARALSKAMAVYKKGILVDSTDPDLEVKVREFQDHYVVAVNGVEDIESKVKEITLGGADEHTITHTQLLRDRLDRNSGIHEAQRGNVGGGNATATEVQTASTSSSIRLGFMIQKFRDGVQEILERVAWYLYHDDSVVFALGPEAQGQFIDPETGNPIQDAMFRGGAEGDETGINFDSLELEIEPYSMQRTDESIQQRRMAELDVTATSIVPLIPQTPYFDWEKYLELRGEFMNVPNLSELVDVEAAREYGAMMMQMELSQPTSGSSQGQPRLRRSVGEMGAPSTGGAPRGQLSGIQSGNILAPIQRT